jgi:predicted unusual protein kinase regulating ubiquinone biosynthesis (AarF/ABC1/UbiB family)
MMGMDCGEQSMEAALIQLIETVVMHADLHDGNILLSPDCTLQLIDFSSFSTWRKSTKEQCWLW